MNSQMPGFHFGMYQTRHHDRCRSTEPVRPTATASYALYHHQVIYHRLRQDMQSYHLEFHQTNFCVPGKV